MTQEKYLQSVTAEELSINPSSINTTFVNGETYLHKAVSCQRWDLLEQLVGIGSDVNLSDDDGWTPLARSLLHEDVPPAAIKLLTSPDNINARVEDEQQYKEWGKTPLGIAVDHQRWDLVPHLIQLGANINVPVSQLGTDVNVPESLNLQQTALHRAVVSLNKHTVPLDILHQLTSTENVNLQS